MWPQPTLRWRPLCLPPVELAMAQAQALVWVLATETVQGWARLEREGN